VTGNSDVPVRAQRLRLRLLGTLSRTAKTYRRLVAISAFWARRIVNYTRDLWFDVRHGVQTRGQVRSFAGSQPGTAFEHAQPYVASRRKHLHRAIAGLPIDCAQFTFVDIGSGKGKALVIAATLGFRRVIGVELADDLHRIAVSNAQKLASRNPRASLMEPLRLNAADFVFPADPLLCYMYNPFDRVLVEEVVANIRDSLRQTPRPAFIIYVNPVSAEVLRGSDLGQILHDDRHYLSVRLKSGTLP
jgi:SAM-dependent methyltransferase